MATITVSNPGSTAVYCGDLYCSIAAGGSVTTTRAVSDLSRMASLQSLIAAGTVTMSIVYSAAERASGLVPETEVAAAATGVGDMETLRFTLTAGGGGSPDDVTLYDLGALPYKKFRIVDAYAYVSAGNSGGRTIQIRTASGGSGTLCAEISAATGGRTEQTTSVTATSAITNSSTVGLFARRSDSAIAGEVVIQIRIES